jgi:acyl transferase domain-containing protein/acyl carrier protein
MIGLNSPDYVVNESDIAIVGLSGRFPGAEDADAFWRNLCDGIESISNFTDDEMIASGIDPILLQNPNYVRASGVISGYDHFDAFFFGYSPGEAETMDPQHRLFLEHAWHALENAGYNPETYEGLIGAYAGASMNTYLYNNLRSHQDLMAQGGGYHTMVASDKDFLATKASYKLNLKGPSVTVQTACSTSLVAVHMACQSLRNGECDMALAGGVSVRVPHQAGYLYQDGIVLSPDGHCRAFDAKASGTVIGSGVGIVVLKMLVDAIDDGDRILAVIKGSAVNNDGSLKAGYTAPSLDAQAAVITEAQGVAGVEADSITYIEAHGTGTTIGDPIEVAALTKAFRIGTERQGFCSIGSVKTNIGHLDAAAGVAGLIKTVLALWHGQIPPSLNFEEPNPRIDFAHSPFHVNTDLSKWETNGAARRAGVSAFGIGGTNAHVVLEEAPVFESAGPSRPWQLLLLSARTESALDTVTANLAAHLKQHPDLDLADVAYTLQVGRKRFEYRRALTCRDVEEAMQALDDLDPTRVLVAAEEATGRPVAFMFTGQGAQYVNMGLELYQSESVFCEAVDRCCDVLKPHLGLDLRDILYPPEGQGDEATEQLNQTALTQPALFVVEYALARLWQSWGVYPRAMIGHSIGEYVAACLAGVFRLEDALALVAIRGRLMQQMPPGAMLSVPLPEQDVIPFLGEGLSVGVINGPARCAISGPTEAIEALEARLGREGVTCRRLHTSHAYHSAMMDPVLKPFADEVARVALNPPQLPCISNVTGTWLTDDGATDPGYWANHLRRTVRFAEGVQRLMQDPDCVLLEVGPGRMLTTLATRHPARSAEQFVLSSLRHPQDEQSDVAFLLTALGKLWLAGVTIDWAGVHGHERRLRVPLPLYPFERQRHWIEPNRRPASAGAATGALEPLRKADVADWFYVPSWKRSVAAPYRPNGDTSSVHWLLFDDGQGLGAELARRLEGEGRDVVTVKVGPEFARVDEHTYTANPGRPEDYVALLADLRERDGLPQKLAHLWSVTSPDDGTESRLDRLDRAQDLGFYSLLFLMQAIGQQNITDELSVTAISDGVHEVTGEEDVRPERATVLGPILIAPHEYANVDCRNVDVELKPGSNLGQLAEQILGEVLSESADQIVAYRGAHRWVRTYEPVRLEKVAGADLKLREGGVYLVTGGLGGIGLQLARYLAETMRARLVLTGRSVFPTVEEWDGWLTLHGEDDPTSRKIRKLRELEALGAEVLVARADVTDPAQMREVVAQALDRFSALNGVIHAAGVPGGGVMQIKTREEAEGVMSPKVRGTLVLDAILKDVELDFVVLCSSVNAIVGRMGQVDYCAANAFLDAFVHRNRSGEEVPTICITWDTWREVGMAARMLERSPETAASQPREVAHPLLDRCIVERDDLRVYSTTFRVPEHWMLHEHGIMGKPTLPGTTYLEMARAAFDDCVGGDRVEIRDVYFSMPLVLENDEEREARVVLRRVGDAFEFSVVSCLSAQEDAWLEHAKGTIVATAAEPPRRRAIAEVEGRCDQQEIVDPLAQTRLGHFEIRRCAVPRGITSQGEPLSVDSIVITELDGGSRARSMEFGPRWQGLQRVKLGANEGVALIELPAAFEQDFQFYQLHPALLDFSTSFLRLFKSQGSYLPLSYKRLRMIGSLPGRVYSHVRSIDDDTSPGVTRRFDVTIMDEQGTELVAIEEFAVAKVGDADRLSVLSGARPLSALIPPVGSKPRGGGVRTRMLEEDLSEGLSPAQGVDVFDRVMHSALTRVVVSARDLLARIAQSRARSERLFAEGLEAMSQRLKHPRPKLMTPYAAPRDEIEQKLAEIWQDVLGVEQVGVHDSFFDLGGDSLLITRIHSRFRRGFEHDMSVASMLQYPTIADLAQALGEQTDGGEQLKIEQVQDRTGRQKAAMRRRREKMMKKAA